MHVDEAVVDRSAEEGSRCVVLALLREADDAAQRLAGRDDAEALHDFRVGLRRLRTALRSFAPWLRASVRRRDPKRVRKLAKASNAARDAEVHLAFLESQDTDDHPQRRAGLELLRERLEARREGVDVDRLVAKYRRLSRRLAERVPRFEVRLDGSGTRAPFATALAAVVGEQLQAVRDRAAAIGGPDDEERIHKTRIAVKRLRYALEPLRGHPQADARGAVRELKQLQDVLGDLHDAHTLSHEVEAAFMDASAERARRLFAALSSRESGPALHGTLRGGPRAGLLAVARVVRERRDDRYGELERTWRAGRLDALAAEVAHLTSALERAAQAPAASSQVGEAAPELSHQAATTDGPAPLSH